MRPVGTLPSGLEPALPRVGLQCGTQVARKAAGGWARQRMGGAEQRRALVPARQRAS